MKSTLFDKIKSDAQAELEVERTLVDRYGFNKDTVRRRYSSVIEDIGLSGNAQSDLNTLRSDLKEIESRAEKVAKIQNMGPVDRRVRTIAASASRFGASMLRGLETMGRKGLELQIRNMPLGTATPPGVRGPDVRLPDNVSTFLRDVKNTSGQAYGEDPKFRQTFEGKLLEGGTQLLGQIGTMGIGLVPQMYDEAVSDAEQQYGIPYEQMSEDMQSRVDQTAATYSVLAAALERVGLGKITKGLLGKNSTKALTRLLNVAQAAAAEGVTEAMQGETLDLLAKAIQSDGRQWWTSDTLMQRFEEFTLGAILGGVARGTFEGGDALYQKFLDPQTAATKTDFKAIQDVKTEEVAATVLQKTGDIKKAELAAKAHQGDEQARKEYVDSHYYQEGELSDLEKILSPDELAAIYSEFDQAQGDTAQSSIIQAEDQFNFDRVKERGMLDLIDFLSSRIHEKSNIIIDDRVGSLQTEVEDRLNQGFTEEEVNTWAYEKIRIAGENARQDYIAQGLKPQDFQIFGKNETEFKRNVFRDVSRIYKGADPFTVIEEVNHGAFERAIAEGVHTLDDFIAWKAEVERLTGEKTHGNGREDVREWVSEQAKAWIAGQAKLDVGEKLPSAFRQFLDQAIEYFKYVFEQAVRLVKLSKEGLLPQDFETFLNRSLGLDENFLQQQAREVDLQNLEQSISEGFSMRPFQNDNERSQVEKNREATPEERKYARAQRDAKLAGTTTPEQRQKLSELRIRATESRKREKLRESAARKLEAEVQKRTKAILQKAQDRQNLEAAIRELESMVQALPLPIRGKFKGFADLSTKVRKDTQDRFLKRAEQRIQNIFDEYLLKENRNALLKDISRYKRWIAEAKMGKRKLSFDSEKVEQFINDITGIMADRILEIQNRITKLQGQIERATDLRVEADLQGQLEEALVLLLRKNVYAEGITGQEIAAMREELSQLVEEGRTTRETNESRRRAIVRTAGRAIVNEVGGIQDKGTIVDQNVNIIRQAFNGLLRAEYITEIMTGKKDSILKKYVFEPLFQSEQEKMASLEKLHGRLNEIFSGIDVRSALGSKTLIEIDGEKFSLDEAMAVYAYSQNERGEAHLQSTARGKVQLNRTVQNQIIAAIPTEYKQAVDRMIDYFDGEQYDRVAEVFRDDTGAVLPKEPRYFPITNLSGVGSYNSLLKDFFDAGVSMRKGFTKMRQNSERPFEELSFFATAVNGAVNAEHFIAYAPALKQVNSILMTDKVKAAMNQRSKNLADELRMWVSDVANGRIREGQKGFDRILNLLRRNATVAVLGFNLITAFKQPASLFPALRRGDAGSILSAAIEFSSPSNAIQMRKLAIKKSTFLKTRSAKVQTEIAEMAQRGQVRSLLNSQTRWKQFQDISFAPMRFVDAMTATIVWTGQYRSALKRGLNEKAAIREADMLTRQTQSTGDLINSARLYRSGGATKIFLSFTTDLNMALNNMVSDLSTSKTNRELLLSVGMYYMLSALWMAIAGALGNEFYQLIGLAKPEDNNLQEVLNAVGGEFIGQTLGGIPLMNWATGAYYNLSNEPGKGYFYGRINPVAFAGLNELSKGDFEGTATGTAMLVGVPGVPLWKKLIKAFTEDE